MSNIAPLPAGAGSTTIFMTGITGGLGAGLLPRLLKLAPQERIVALIRGASDAEVARKLRDALDFSGITQQARQRVSAVRGDIGAPMLGLAPDVYAQLAAQVTDIYHLAADLRFDLPLAQSRQSNVDSTAHMVAFASAAANAGGIRRFNYASTAYVTGDRRGLLRESELDMQQGYFNAYEQSKMEAEQLVEASKPHLPVTIYRPSMIIGDSETGAIRNFFGFYEFVKLARKGRVPVICAEPDMRPDLVPLDYVADGMTFLSRYAPAAGQTYHLVAGLERSLPIRTAVELVYGGLDGGAGRAIPEMVTPAQFDALVTGRRLTAFKNSPLNFLLRTYLPYLVFDRQFDMGATARLLSEHGIEMAPVAGVLPRVCEYAYQQEFGERAVQLAVA